MTKNQATFNKTAAAAICPHCEQANQCAVAAGEAADSCWCMVTPVNPTLAERYAGQQRCLCPHCGQTTFDEPLSEGSHNER